MPYEVLPLCANRHLHQQFNAFLVASVFNQLPFVQPIGNGLKHLVGELGILRPDLEAGYQVLPVFRLMKFPIRVCPIRWVSCHYIFSQVTLLFSSMDMKPRLFIAFMIFSVSSAGFFKFFISQFCKVTSFLHFLFWRSATISETPLAAWVWRLSKERGQPSLAGAFAGDWSLLAAH